MKIRAVVNLMLSRGFVGAGSDVDVDDATAERLVSSGLAVVVDFFAGVSTSGFDVEISSGSNSEAQAKKKRKK